MSFLRTAKINVMAVVGTLVIVSISAVAVVFLLKFLLEATGLMLFSHAFYGTLALTYLIKRR
jgi:hypothetical protein